MTETVLSQLDGRIPVWDTQSLRDRHCPFCGGVGQGRYIRRDGLHVRSCDTCGAFFVSPAPDEESLGLFYGRYHATHSREIRPGATALLGADPYADFRIAEVSTYVNLSGARVLDVGCGWGALLYKLGKTGADVYGVDLDAEAVQFARDDLHLPNVRIGRIEDCTHMGPFDIIAMLDFIEHPVCPLHAFRVAASVLKPGGLLMIWTPNALIGADDPQPMLFRVDLEHMQYMSFRTCWYVAQTLALQIVHMESLGFPDLDGIELPRNDPIVSRASSSIVKRLGRKVPGVGRLLHYCRRGVTPPPADPRRGSYNLFCIFRSCISPTRP